MHNILHVIFMSISVYFCQSKNLKKIRLQTFLIILYHFSPVIFLYSDYPLSFSPSHLFISLSITVKNTKVRQNKWSLQSLTYLWLVRFAHSRGFCMGEYGKFGSERNIIITTRNISNIYYITLCG